MARITAYPVAHESVESTMEWSSMIRSKATLCLSARAMEIVLLRWQGHRVLGLSHGPEHSDEAVLNAQLSHGLLTVF